MLTQYLMRGALQQAILSYLAAYGPTNTLDLHLNEEIHKNLMEDGLKADMFFRYNPSLQVFMDNSARLG